MQWAMSASYNTPLLRGNEPIAFQQFRPPYLSKPEFLAYGALRAYPRTQFRKVCPAPSSVNPRPSIFNPQPSALGPQPSTLNPSPQT